MYTQLYAVFNWSEVTFHQLPHQIHDKTRICIEIKVPNLDLRIQILPCSGQSSLNKTRLHFATSEYGLTLPIVDKLHSALWHYILSFFSCTAPTAVNRRMDASTNILSLILQNKLTASGELL